MKKIAIFVALGCFLVGSLAALLVIGGFGSDHKSDILNVLTKYQTAIKAMDFNSLQTLIDEEISIRSKFETSTLTKKEFIERISLNNLRIISADFDYQSCEIYANTATVLSAESVSVELSNDRNVTQKALREYTLRKNNGKWVISGVNQLELR